MNLLLLLFALKDLVYFALRWDKCFPAFYSILSFMIFFFPIKLFNSSKFILEYALRCGLDLFNIWMFTHQIFLATHQISSLHPLKFCIFSALCLEILFSFLCLPLPHYPLALIILNNNTTSYMIWVSFSLLFFVAVGLGHP